MVTLNGSQGCSYIPWIMYLGNDAMLTKLFHPSSDRDTKAPKFPISLRQGSVNVFKQAQKKQFLKTFMKKEKLRVKLSEQEREVG